MCLCVCVCLQLRWMGRGQLWLWNGWKTPRFYYNNKHKRFREVFSVWVKFYNYSINSTFHLFLFFYTFHILKPKLIVDYYEAISKQQKKKFLFSPNLSFNKTPLGMLSLRFLIHYDFHSTFTCLEWQNSFPIFVFTLNFNLISMMISELCKRFTGEKYSTNEVFTRFSLFLFFNGLFKSWYSNKQFL